MKTLKDLKTKIKEAALAIVNKKLNAASQALSSKQETLLKESQKRNKSIYTVAPKSRLMVYTDPSSGNVVGMEVKTKNKFKEHTVVIDVASDHVSQYLKNEKYKALINSVQHFLNE